METQKKGIFITALVLVVLFAAFLFYYQFVVLPFTGHLVSGPVQDQIFQASAEESKIALQAVTDTESLNSKATAALSSSSTSAELSSLSSTLADYISQANANRGIVQTLVNKYLDDGQLVQNLVKIDASIVSLNSLLSSVKQMIQNLQKDNAVNVDQSAVSSAVYNAGELAQIFTARISLESSLAASSPPIVEIVPTSLSNSEPAPATSPVQGTDVPTGPCGYAGYLSPLNPNAVNFGSIGVQTNGLSFQSCPYLSPDSEVSSSPNGDEVTIKDSETGLTAAVIRLSPQTSPGVLGQEVFAGQVEINFYNGEDHSLSPSSNNCANQVMDGTEKLIDCGGDCVACSPGTGKIGKSLFFWILFGFLSYSLFYFNSFGAPRIIALVKKGNKALADKDLRKAIECYKYISHYYYHLDERSQEYARQSISNYYKLLKKELESAGILVHKPLYHEDFPELVYEDKKIGLMRVGNELHRVEKLMDESLRDLKKGNKKEAFTRKSVIVDMYNSLSKQDKERIEGTYRKYLMSFLTK